MSSSAQETHSIGERIGRSLPGGSVVALSGPLGAGKTALTKGIAAGLGVHEPVTSPTYTIVSEYQGRLRLLHVDLYRIAGAEEYLELGIDEEINAQTTVLVEWPEHAESALPSTGHSITITITGPESRTIETSDALLVEEV